jgi:hypothetical protein
MEEAGRALSTAELAHNLLGTPPGASTRLGAAVLEPVLRGEPGLAETPGGWVIRPATRSGDGVRDGAAPLDGPFFALGVVIPHDDGPPRWHARRHDGAGDARDGPAGSGADGETPDDTPSGQAGALAGSLVVSARGASDLRLAGLDVEPSTSVPLVRLARALAGTPARAALDDVAARLGLRHTVEEGPVGAARLAATVWLDLRERLREEGWLDADGLVELLDPGKQDASAGFLSPERTRELPETPGVYRFLDADGRLLYVGKSVNVRARVVSYFRGAPRDGKDRRLRREAAAVRTEALGSEPEAILREHELLRRHAPPLNVQVAVGERPALNGARILVLPGPTERRRTLLMLREGVLEARLTIGVRRPGREKARAALRSVYFSDAPPDDASSARDGGLLVASWLRRHPNRALWFDPTERRGVDEALALLGRYLDADPRGGPLFLR